MDTLTLARSLTSLLLDTAAKGTVLLLLACLVSWLCRRSSAALRHSIWCMTMGGLLLLPVASWALPTWQIPILPPEPVPTPVVAEVVRLSPPEDVAPSSEPHFSVDSPPAPRPAPQLTGPLQIEAPDPPVVMSNSEPQPVSSPAALPVPAVIEPSVPPLTTAEQISIGVSTGWSLGVSVFGALLLVGLWRTVRMRRRSVVIGDGEWPGLLAELKQHLGLARSVELREHAESVVPLTWGIWRPVVLVPKLAREWAEPMRRAVLLHELAHVQRGDVACQILGRLTCVLYWFHPLVWFALRQLRQEREQACDDAVIHSGEKASDYAEQLLAVARLCMAPRGLSLGVAMAEGSSLERRVVSLFDSARNHGPLTRRVALACLLVGGAILAGLAPIQPTASQAEPSKEAQPVPVRMVYEKAYQATVDILTKTSAPKSTAVFLSDKNAKISGMGSGIVVDSQGFIVTANHVVDGKDTIEVTLHDGTKLPASVVGQDPTHDLAVLKVHAPAPLVVMPENPNQVLKVFDEVWAIGNAFGWSHSVSKGIISGLGRDLELSEDQRYQNLIQTDAALNPGASGGPLLNAQGEAIGINIAIRAGAQKISFAIPIADARKVFVGLMRPIISGASAKEQMDLLNPVFGEAKRGVQLGLAIGSLERTFPDKSRIPLWLFYRNVSDKELTFNLSQDFMNDPVLVTDASGKRVQVNFVMHWMFIPPLTITLKPGEVWCIATTGLNLSERMPSIKPVAGKYKLTYPQGIWSTELEERLEIEGTIAGQVVKSPTWSEQLETGTIEFEIAPNKVGGLEARILASLPAADSNIAEAPAASITSDSRVRGRVENARGEPVPQALVLYPYDFDKVSFQWRVARTVANEHGEFELTIPKHDLFSGRLALGVAWSWAKGHGIGTVNIAQILVTRKQIPVRIVLPEAKPSTFRVVNGNGKPLAGVSVTPDQIRVPNGSDPIDGLYPLFYPVPEELRTIASRQTDADGRVTLDLVPHQWLYCVRVITTSHGEQLFTWPKEELKLHPVVPVEGTLTGFGEGIHLTFSTRREQDGEANVDVVTGANGSFSIPAFPEGMFDVSSFDLQPPVFLNRPTTELRAGGDNSVVLSTTTGIPVKGRLVVRGTNRGVPKARISVRFGSHWEYAADCTSNETGEFSSFAVPGQHLRIQVHSLEPSALLIYPGFTMAEIPGDAREFTVPDIAVDPAKKWYGKLVDDAGTPIEGVYVVPRLGEKTLKDGARTSSSGAFQVALKATETPNSWHVIWDASLPEPKTVSAEVVSQDPLVLRTQRLMKPGEAPAVGLAPDAPPKAVPEELLIQGQVVDARGKPLPQVQVIYPVNLKATPSAQKILETATNAQGEFGIAISGDILEKSYLGRDVVWATKEGLAIGAAVAPFLDGMSAMRIVIPDKAPVEFIVQADNGQPLAGVKVASNYLKIPNWNGTREDQQGVVTRLPEFLKARLTQVSDAQGRVVFDVVPRNWHYQLQMTSEPYGVQSFSDPRKFLKLLPVAPMTGKLSNGQAGVKLICTIPHQYFGSHIMTTAEAVTDAAGRFSIPKFPVGPVKITSPDLHGPMFLEATDREVVAGANNDFELKVISGIQVRGRVMLEKPRRGIRKAAVGFSSDDGAKPVETDEDGNYTTFARPQPTISTYFIGTSAESFPLIGSGLGISAASVQVPEGATEVTLPDIVLSEGLMLTGQLIDENKQPVGGVYVAPFPATSPFQLQTGPTGTFSTLIRADKHPSGWVVGWNLPPDPTFEFSDNTTWGKVISQEPLILQVSHKSQPERIIPYSEIDMDAPVPMDQVVWGEIVDGWQPGIWLKSTGEPTNQQVPLNALVTYRLLLRNTSDKGRDVVFRRGPDVPYVIPSSQLAQALSTGELPKKYQSEVSKLVYKGVSDHVIFVAAGESLLLYGSDTSTQAGLFVGAGDSQRYSRLPTVAQPGKNWIVQPLMVQTLTPEERTQLEESLKSDRSRSNWDMTMLDRNGQPRKETAKTATPQAKGIVGIPLTRFQTLYAKIERDVGTLVAAVPQAPVKTPEAPEEPQNPMEKLVWGDAIGGLQTSILCDASPDAPGIVELNELLHYGVPVRNSTDRRLDVLVRIELPYLVPEEQMQGELSSQFRAAPLLSNPQRHAAIYRLSLEAGESVFLPGLNTTQAPEAAVSVGDAQGAMPDEEGDFPRIATVHVGTNWLVQPLTIQMLSAEEAAVIRSLPGEFAIMKIDAKGKPSEAKVSLVDATLTGKTVVAKQRVEVATRSFLSEQHADDVTWGRIDKGLQCGIRLRNPQASYKTGDSLEIEVFWRNSSDDPLTTPMPLASDLYPVIRNPEGRELLVDLGARKLLVPIPQKIESKQVRSLGIKKVTLVAEGPPSPQSDSDPAHITLAPGNYWLSAFGGVSSPETGNPQSGEIAFVVVSPPVVASASAAPAHTISGQIVNNKQEPLAGAEVVLALEEDDNDSTKPGRVVAQATTDAEGRYVLTLPAEVASSKKFGAIWARAKGHTLARGHWSSMIPALSNRKDQLTLTATSGTKVQVLDQSGKPLEGVRVRASRIGITDSVGYAPPPGWDDRIFATTDSHGDATLIAAVPESIQGLSLQPPGDSAELQFGRNYFLNVRPAQQGRHFSVRLPATGSVDGQLKVAEGARLPEGLTLTVRSCSLELPQFDGVVRVPVAADGTFRIQQIPVGQLIVPPFLPEDQPLRAVVPPHVEVQTGKTAKLEIAVAPGVQVQGRVIRSDLKTGFANYPVTVIYGQSITNRRVDFDQQKFELKTNEEGVFTCVVPPGPIEVQTATYRDGYQKASSWLPKEQLGMWGGTRFTVPQRKSFELEPIELTKSVPIQGKLIDQNKAVVEGWMVHGYPEVPGFEPSATMNSFAGVHTMKNGHFEGRYPQSYPPVRWKVSHRVRKTNFEFDDIEYQAKVIQKEPLILQVDTTKPIE